jgi:hypothetical protein
MEKPKYLLGEPVFCRFVIRNSGRSAFTFRYRTPSRALSPDNDQEPRFEVKDARGERLADPGPRPCGNPQGTDVYGFVTLPPGEVHTERWLLNQWARFVEPGSYQVRAERRLALLPPGAQTAAQKPLAFALAIDELTLVVAPGSPTQVDETFEPFVATTRDPNARNFAEAVVVLTWMPQPFFLDRLVAMASAGERVRWNRRDALDGLARLNTPASWNAILKVFSSGGGTGHSHQDGARPAEEPLSSYALLLLAEKGDPAFIPTFVEILAQSPEPRRGEILRALGFFHDPRAYQLLFDNLHSAQASDRVDAILGLKTLGGRDVIPALLAALDDPEPQVRQVASFALQGLTGHQAAASTNPSREEAERAARDWHSWWRVHAATFSPPPPAACHEW